MDRISHEETTLWVDTEGGHVTIGTGSEELVGGSLTLDRRALAEAASISATTDTHTGGLTLSLVVENDGAEPLSVDELSFESTVEAFGPDTRVFEHGYQSWSPTASVPVGERFPEERDDNAPMMLDLAAPDDRRTSNFLTAVSDGNQTLTMGFLEHDRACTRFDIDDDSSGVHAVDAVAAFDGITLEPGETLEVPTLWIDTTRDPSEALDALATAIGEEMDARVPETVPTGWCSWYHYFTDVTEADVRENLSELDAWEIPVDIVQLDDGYMRAFGDWRTIDEDFDDLTVLADDIEAAGYTPGLWLAPFYVEQSANLFTDHPEWFITDPETGEPVDGGYRAGDHLYGLDTTHPEVKEWLRETFETVVDTWGFQYLKLDFLFASALPGDRYDNDCTRIEAYRTGLEMINETVGDDVFILGCGAPLAPSIGLVDAMRIGPDTDPVWETPGESASQPALKNAVRNTLTRQFLHRKWWINDPDCQLVRETSDLTTAERESFATLVAMTGGVNIFSDRIAEIDPAGKRLLERTLAPAETATVESLLGSEFPDLVRCERPGDGAPTVAVFNWADEPQTVSVDPSDHVEGGVRIWDGLAGTEVTVDETTGLLERTLPAHGCAVFAFTDGTDPVGDKSTLLGSPGLE